MWAVRLVLLSAVCCTAKPWLNKGDDPTSRATKLVAEMTVDEKVGMLHGSHSQYVGTVSAIPRLGVPEIKMNDGPQGFRDNARPGSTTAWPSGLTVAASFDVEVTGAWGDGMGKEFWGKGANVQLGPGLCLARVPRNGRNFEYLSGEDPFLGYSLVQPVITAIQRHGVVANAKHWVNNNQETDRTTVSEDVDERTQFEMYYPPFEGAVEAGVGSVMCSYNKIRGTYSCENPETLARDLKERLGFKGWVMSDWGATHSTSINEGLDQEMPGSTYMGAALKAKVESGAVSMAKLNDSVVRVLTPLFALGVFDNPNPNSITNNVTSAAHNTLARTLSAKSTVLLKNDNDVLPLPTTGNTTVAIIGSQAVSPVVHGGGSGQVVPYYTAAPLDSILAKLGISGCKGGCKEKVCSSSGVCITYNDGSDPAKAAAAAQAADVALVFASTTSSEGSDRKSLSLDQDSLVQAVAAQKTPTVVVAVTPGAILTPWRHQVSAILVPFMPGQEYGNAITDILFGDVAPSARLPLTFPNSENEVGFTPQEYPGVALHANYSEKLLVGYRWYTHHKITPAFPFGHGLSYTTFAYRNLMISSRTVSFTLVNTGKRSGVETPQLYLGFPASAGEPLRQLKGFRKVFLDVGKSTEVTFQVRDRDLSVWDVTSHSWKVAHGTFQAFVGASVDDIRLQGTFTV
eukprot:Sspe_Gene.10360::Locus_3458_Transcript_1_1_Confidence_1.000_Length_2315::g.10360::m.10360/K05349/bglX; beta-glucosidase